MPGLSFSNKLISPDEGLHCNFACLLYSKLINPLPKECVINIISSAVNIEMEFVVNALPIELIGMNSNMMCNYIKFYSEQLLIVLGCCQHYKNWQPIQMDGNDQLPKKNNVFQKMRWKIFKILSGSGQR
jgi:ribonucleotide reductase beta subunit family protein with ferritin-like domain